MGVNAIELMPVQEFDGNDSWGYNPCFFFAMDKAYGTKAMYKQFIDACGELTSKYLDTLEADVSHYCKMYDYRNTGANADWGNSKDSIERAIKFLTTR